MKVNVKQLLLALLFFANTVGMAQTTWTLEELIDVARKQALALRLAEADRHIAESDWQQFRRTNLPRVRLNGSLPNFSSAFQEITQPDGSIQFSPVRNNNSFLGLQVQQNVPLTGGILQADFAFQRFDDFAEDRQQYFVQPFSLTYFQPFFQSNPQKWNKRIAPLQKEWAEKNYLDQRNQVDQFASEHFFNVLLQQQGLQIIEDQHKVAKQLYTIAQERYKLGHITKSDLLQLEIQTINTEQNIQNRQLEVSQAKERMQVFLQNTPSLNKDLVIPATPPSLSQEAATFTAAAIRRDPQLCDLEIQLLQNRQSAQDLRSQQGWQAGLLASAGWSKSGEQLADAISQPKLQQQVALTFSIPIVDWGDYKQEKKQTEHLKSKIEQQIAFRRQEVQLAMQQTLAQYTQLQQALQTAQRMEALASERFQIVKEQFIHEKISLIELNIATTEKEQAQTQYLSLLRDCWQSYLSLQGVLQ